MIPANSRYASATVVPATDVDGNDILAIVPAAPADTVIRYTYHQVAGTDDVTLLAFRYYGDPTVWWKIANANPEVTNWATITTGSLIRVPIITGLS